MMQDVSLAAAFGRLLVVAVLMAAVLLVLRRTTQRRGTGAKKRNGTTRTIELVDRQPLGKTQSVAVLRVHDCTLVVGVTEQRIDLLATLEAPFDEELDDRDLDVRGTDVLDLTGYELREDDEEFFEKLRRRSAR